MNKNHIVTKQIFRIKFDNGIIKIACTYNTHTKFIGVKTERNSYYKHDKNKLWYRKLSPDCSVCSTLQKHADILKDDNERMTSDFILRCIRS